MLGAGYCHEFCFAMFCLIFLVIMVVLSENNKLKTIFTYYAALLQVSLHYSVLNRFTESHKLVSNCQLKSWI